MSTKEKRLLVLFVVFGLVSLASAALPELGGESFEGYDGLGRGIFIALFITIPTAILAMLFLFLFIAEKYRSKHPDS